MVTDQPKRDPLSLARSHDRPALPRRFYSEAAAEARDGAFVLTLDGRAARTPGRRLLAVASEQVAAAIADEWQAQGETIDPSTMPLTRIVNSAIDGVASREAAVRQEIVAYAGSDLICYRAEGPAALIARQAAAWDPLVAWAAELVGERLVLGQGVVPVAQPPAILLRFGEALMPLAPIALAALHVTTTLTGSAFIALAVARGRLAPEAAWQTANVDEDWQVEQWGADAEAAARRDARWADMKAAAFILAEA